MKLTYIDNPPVCTTIPRQTSINHSGVMHQFNKFLIDGTFNAHDAALKHH